MILPYVRQPFHSYSFFHLLLCVSFYRQLKAAYSFAFFKTIKMISDRMFYYLTKNCFIFIL